MDVSANCQRDSSTNPSTGSIDCLLIHQLKHYGKIIWKQT
jgi:hypothetical protein